MTGSPSAHHVAACQHEKTELAARAKPGFDTSRRRCYDANLTISTMISLVLRDVLLIAAGFGLYRMWRAAQPSQQWLGLVVVVGFLARAILGSSLFPLSYAPLPV